jgi:DMSO/TMAO reductase YedYZ molybdopterin-dependent catalytic subunit
MNIDTALPPGQIERADFPRFGLRQFAQRFPVETVRRQLQIAGDVQHRVLLEAEFAQLTRVQQCSDFHCVTTWTHRSLQWSGVRFGDFYQQLVLPLAVPAAHADFVVLRSQDGYRCSLPLVDLLADDVLLADRLNDQPLSIAHGAPLRLVAPAHYGYKSIKHLKSIEFFSSAAGFRPVGLQFMAHPRARVAFEERGQWVPGWLLRQLYRPLVHPTAVIFARALQRHLPPS